MELFEYMNTIYIFKDTKYHKGFNDIISYIDKITNITTLNRITVIGNDNLLLYDTNDINHLISWFNDNGKRLSTLLITLDTKMYMDNENEFKVFNDDKNRFIYVVGNIDEYLLYNTSMVFNILTTYNVGIMYDRDKVLYLRHTLDINKRSEYIDEIRNLSPDVMVLYR